MQRKIVRVKDGEWCALELRLENGRLSICGSAGRVLRRAQAKREALEYWESYFQEAPGEIIRLGRRTAMGAAKHVIATDGELHGVDVYRDDDKTLLVLSCCGQIREELLSWFPEVRPYLKWHLNDMRAECEHQEARGETYATHPAAVCPDCGYSLGSAWTKRELPADVETWVREHVFEDVNTATCGRCGEDTGVPKRHEIFCRQGES